VICTRASLARMPSLNVALEGNQQIYIGRVKLKINFSNSRRSGTGTHCPVGWAESYAAVFGLVNPKLDP
jgi:hypothetical protein